MTRLRADILILLLGATCVLAAVDNSTSLMPMSTSTPKSTSAMMTTSAMMVTSTAAPVMSTTMPMPTQTPTAMPPTDMPPNQDFQLMKNGSLCLWLNSSIELSVEYTNGTKKDDKSTATAKIPVHNGAIDYTSSFCNEPTKGTKNNFTTVLVIDWMSEKKNPFSIKFLFTDNLDKGNQYWALDILDVTLNTNSSDFPGYNNASGVQSLNLHKEIFKNDFNRSYLCNSEISYQLNSLRGMTVKVMLERFQVQVFSFTNSTSGKFDNARRCDKDLRGSKIVPIAVGAALAGLVIVVLIAYLIGRFRSRRQSSYEALS